MNKIIVIAGPTAVGKTSLSIKLCQELGGEVVSADSMQIYKSLDVGTAKPTLEERCGIPHHMIDVCDPWIRYSVADYVLEATKAIDGIVSKGKVFQHDPTENSEYDRNDNLSDISIYADSIYKSP